MSVLSVSDNQSLRIHATNIVGLGASNLALSLFPAFESLPALRHATLFLPSVGPLAGYHPAAPHVSVRRKSRVLPNGLSRALECWFPRDEFRGEGGILVLGDIPLRGYANQVVFVNQSNLFQESSTTGLVEQAKYLVARRLFEENLDFVKAFVVQTDVMKMLLVARYPRLERRISVLGQPVPSWFCPRTSTSRKYDGRSRKLRLLYPAAPHSHKNHHLLGEISEADSAQWPVERLVLTIPPRRHPNPNVRWIDCVGELDHSACLEAYEDSDALLFLSLTESYGFPLVEAMSMGLPIVCPDLPYSRALCGSEAFYFEPKDIGSLRAAIVNLHCQLGTGWRPDWSSRLARIPGTWRDVAQSLFDIVNL